MSITLLASYIDRTKYILSIANQLLDIVSLLYRLHANGIKDIFYNLVSPTQLCCHADTIQ